MGNRLRALMWKEFIQLRRDRRTLAMLIFLPVLWLVAFGYAVNFDIDELDVAFVDEAGNEASGTLRQKLQEDDHFRLSGGNWHRNEAEEALKKGAVDVVLMIPSGYDFLSAAGEEIDPPRVIVDGSQLFSAQSAVRYFGEFWGEVHGDHLRKLKGELRETLTGVDEGADIERSKMPEVNELAQMLPPDERTIFLERIQDGIKEQMHQQINDRADELMASFPDFSAIQPDVDVMYNPDMKTVDFMIPGLVGLVLIFITTLMTALGIVKEQERGTLEQLVVSPVSSFELMLGKVLPYVIIALVDFLLVFAVGIWWFDVPFEGHVLPFFAVSLMFLICSLGIGLLVSTVSQTQQQAMQLAIFTLVPQFILSGFIFPLESIPWGIRWVSYLMPLTYFVPISRGVFLKGADVMAYVQPAFVLSVYATILILVATLRFRRKLG